MTKPFWLILHTIWIIFAVEEFQKFWSFVVGRKNTLKAADL
jgi:hypothetical protein